MSKLQIALSFLDLHSQAIGLVASLVTIVGILWRWGRRILVAIIRWGRSIWDEARPEARLLKHPLLIQSGDRGGGFWSETRRGPDKIFEVFVVLKITNLELREIHISKARLRWR